LSNSAGALVNTYTYDSFGKLTASTGTLVNPFQYTGREFDPETGLYEYRARYYDQNVGRFKSEDPIRFGGGINFYRYVGNNAVNRTDPDGMGAAACAKAMAELAAAELQVAGRLANFTKYADGEPGHAKALQQALNRLNNAVEDVKKNCTCTLLTAGVVAALAAAATLAEEAAAALAQFCSEVPCMAKNDGYPFPEDKHLPVYIAHPDGEPGYGKELGHAVPLKKEPPYLAVAA
jgi:RHS repeat-associated protein